MTHQESVVSSDTAVHLPVSPEQVRVLVDPIEPKAKSRAMACVHVKTVLDSGLGDWLEANVRHQKMGSGIAKEIVHTLDERPENFHPLNRGLTILSNGFRYDSQSKVLSILLRDPKKHGIIDGGHTYRAIELVIRRREGAGGEPPNAFVNLEVLSGYDEISPDIIGARNSVCAVRPSAIYSLEGVFNDLRHHLQKAGLESLVAFKQNEDKPISVEEVIATCTLFHPLYADGTSHPIRAYTSRANCAEMYEDEWRKLKDGDSVPWKAGFGKILHLAPDFLRLVEEIEVELDETYRSSGGRQGLTSGTEEPGKEGKSRGRKLKELSGPRDLPVTSKRVKAGWPTGYLYPLVGAMRPVIDYSGELAKWKISSPLEIFRSGSVELVKTLLAFAEEFGRKPNAVGKNQLCWKSLFDTVDRSLLRVQAAQR